MSERRRSKVGKLRLLLLLFEETPDAVRRLRSALRDVQDRMARHRRSWREVGLAGTAGGGSRAVVMISREGVDQDEVEDTCWARLQDGVGGG
jgi:hypothetical protein